MTDTQIAPAIHEHSRVRFAAVGLDLSSVILGAIGLVLFILPILSIPISSAGIVVGVAGIIVALSAGQVSLRLAVAGLLLSICALLIALAIARAPSGYFSPRSVFPTLQPVTERPFVPPPAAPRSAAYPR